MPLKQQFFNLRIRQAGIAHGTVFAQVCNVDECCALQSDVDERALHARQYAHHTTQINIAHLAALPCALKMNLLNDAVLDQGNAGFKRCYVDQNVSTHIIFVCYGFVVGAASLA